ncbi:hypothetical protein LGL08_20805 [Clostridium estertheticum]|uniref:hypothetical protein n=1 Tax=Clostridium estertheticum TaxID=238834 RepID=UPI001CF57988|nr:hypothetical protein [Clostridium estertheticum]MCB2308906.1 hypothetical protein [Clostridium estertheticum]MCB2347343.1 hypothetical protein [Clostridium estertheticum]MCB2351969.1 hypothetical protein [Clostridium estertheticum]WAG46331.1 hypothetical protein LL127_01870 [Clostridium estertheticum]
MNNIKKILAMSLIVAQLSIPALAVNFTVPEFSILIGSSVYELQYANDSKNASAISEALANSEGDIYIQTSKGTWISNSTGLAVAKSLIDNITITSFNGKAIESTDFEDKAALLMGSIKYKVNDANSIAFIDLIQSESKINNVKAENALLLAKGILNDDIFKKSYLGVKSDKAATLIADNKYEEASEAYATCVKYGINIVNNTGYINALSKYAESELVKKTNLNQEDITNYYSVGDIDNDGTLEVAVFERNYSSEKYIPSNIQLFKYTNGEYSLFSTVQTNAERCMSINISKAKDDINGIYVSGIVGAHGGYQSLYIIKDGELTPAIDDIYSLYPSKIKDIDGDGLLELSSLERDPNDPDSSNATCSKILTWYKWDGANGLTTVESGGTN